jgi:hypothetical protein
MGLFIFGVSKFFSYVIEGSDEPPTLDVDDNNSRPRVNEGLAE